MPLLRSHKPRHAKPSKAGPTLAVGGMTATMGALATPAQAASEDDFKRLRVCESSNNYRANTGNGYYGAYQFELRTWRGLGYSGYPHQAAAATQDKAAHELQADRGWSCAALSCVALRAPLGLRGPPRVQPEPRQAPREAEAS